MVLGRRLGSSSIEIANHSVGALRFEELSWEYNIVVKFDNTQIPCNKFGGEY